MFRAADAVGAGVSWRDLYWARDSGLVLELSRGVFQLRDAGGLDEIDFVTVCARVPRAVVCLGSALAYWDLSDEIPGRVDIAVPVGTHRPQIDHPPTRVHVFWPKPPAWAGWTSRWSLVLGSPSPMRSGLSSMRSVCGIAWVRISQSGGFAGTYGGRCRNLRGLLNWPGR